MVDVVLLGTGVALLVFHCGAMFFPRVADRLPGADGAASDVRALGTASIVWFLAAVVLVLLGLRHQHVIGQAAVAVSLAAVGTTMYNGASLQTHLVTIFVSVLALVGVMAALLLPPWRTPQVHPATLGG